MNRHLRFCAGLVAVAALAAGCAKKPPEKPQPPQVQNPALQQEFANAPSWVLNPQSAGKLVAVGSAKVGPAGMQFAREEALAAARDELARMMSVRVKNMVKRFMQTTGVGDAQAVDHVSASVSKQVANQVLSGSRQKDLWISPSGELYVLVELDPEFAKTTIANAIRTSMSKQALWQQFQAKKAFDELQQEIEQELMQ